MTAKSGNVNGFAGATLIDVTLRDGGYLNKWMLSEDVVINYAEFITRNWPVDIIELGYASDAGKYGANGSLKASLLARLRSLPKQKAIMLFQDEEHPLQVLQTRGGLFDVVRIPIRVEEANRWSSVFERCAADKITFTINLTRISAYSEEEIVECVKEVQEYKPYAIYLADSRGACLPEQIRILFGRLRETFPSQVFGMHAHNNLSLALANTHAAVSRGARCFDASLCGTGLGGGNLSLEIVSFLKLKQDPERLKALVTHVYENSHTYAALGLDTACIKFELSAVLNVAQEKACEMDTLASLLAFFSKLQGDR